MLKARKKRAKRQTPVKTKISVEGKMDTRRQKRNIKKEKTNALPRRPSEERLTRPGLDSPKGDGDADPV